MPQRPEPQQITDAVNDFHDQLDHLAERFLPSLVALATARTTAADGYFDAGGDGRGSGELTSVERAVWMRQRASDLERLLWKRWAGLESSFIDMAAALAKANNAAGIDPAIVSMNDADGFCVNCARHGVQSVRKKGSLCDPCYQYRLDHDQSNRPADLIAAHERRRRRVGSLDRTHAARGKGRVEV